MWTNVAKVVCCHDSVTLLLFLIVIKGKILHGQKKAIALHFFLKKEKFVLGTFLDQISQFVTEAEW